MPSIQICSDSFFHNFNILSTFLNPTGEIAIVLKDNAYGHGLKEVSILAKQCGIRACFVKSMQEALEVREDFSSISILYPRLLKDDLSFGECLRAENIYFCVSSLETLKLYPSLSKIELKINTGMNRNGITRDSLVEAFEEIVRRKLCLVGVFTHNGFGDDLGSEFYIQNQNFLDIKKEVLRLCVQHSLPKPRFHSLNSSGALRMKNSQNFSKDSELKDDLYRIGIAFYGYLCQDEVFSSFSLKPIASLWAEKISSHALKKGMRIGYGGVCALQKDSIISSYDIGYGDGLFRLREGIELYTKEGFRILPRSSMD
ncbi:MAG: alanine racemase, partial [Helicobacter sp.]|nr:alanine racemase [Helicobacter sp.]